MKKINGNQNLSIFATLFLILGLTIAQPRSITPQLEKAKNKKKASSTSQETTIPEKKSIKPIKSEKSVKTNIKKEIQKPIAILLKYKGSVKINSKKPTKSQKINRKSIITTSKKSHCTLKLIKSGMTGTILISENSKFSFEKFELGKAEFVVNKIKPTNSFEVRTPLASIGIKGTKLSVEVEKDKTNIIKVTEGKVRIRPRIEELENTSDFYIEHSTGLSHLFISLINKSVYVESGNYAVIDGNDYDKFIKNSGLKQIFLKTDSAAKKRALEEYFSGHNNTKIQSSLENDLIIKTAKIETVETKIVSNKNAIKTEDEPKQNNKTTNNDETFQQTKQKEKLEELVKDKEPLQKQTKIEKNEVEKTTETDEIHKNNPEKAIKTKSNPSKKVEQSTNKQKEEESIEELTNKLKKLADKLNKEIDKSCKETNVLTERKGDKLKISLSPKITFAKASYKLKKEAKKFLKELIIEIKKYPNAQISIEGHTDNQPVKTDNQMGNWRLSTNRALSVLEYFLSSSKIDPSRFVVSGFSKYKPMKNEKSRKQNRRVEIVIVPN